MTARVCGIWLFLALSGMIALTCGSEPVPPTSAVDSPSPVARSPSPTAPTAAPSSQPTVGSEGGEVSVDGDSIAIERSVPFSGRGRALGVRSSTTYSPQTGETTDSTTYVVDARDVNLVWVDPFATPPHLKRRCDEIGPPGSWRGNPSALGRPVQVGPTLVRLDRLGPDALSLFVENVGADRIEIPDYSFELVDGLESRGETEPRDYRPSFAETFELAPGASRTIAIDPGSLSEDAIDPEQVVLTFRSFVGSARGDAAYLRLAEAADVPPVCSSFETHADAQGIGTTWLNRPAPRGRPVKVDEATTVRVAHSERGRAPNLLETYRGLDLTHAFPGDAEGGLADGFELLALQIEVASSYPLMKGDHHGDWLDSITVSGRVADEYSSEFDDMLATPGTGNLAWLEAPADAAELNRFGYMRLAVLTTIPARARNLFVGYRQGLETGAVFLSLEEAPRPAPTPVPLRFGGESSGIGLFGGLDALGEAGVDALLESSSAGSKDRLEQLAGRLRAAHGFSERGITQEGHRLCGGTGRESLR